MDAAAIEPRPFRGDTSDRYRVTKYRIRIEASSESIVRRPSTFFLIELVDIGLEVVATLEVGSESKR